MSLTREQLSIIKNTIKRSLMEKLRNYRPETNNMPFHYRLLGQDRMALFSFIHSLNTTFGTSIFEPIAEILARFNYPFAEKQYVVGNSISQDALNVIQDIINELSTTGNPNKVNEIIRIRNVCQRGNQNNLRTVKVDLCIHDTNGNIYFFDIKTAKPNISNFKDFKRTLLEWIAIYLFEHPEANVHSYIAIPYNPYEPNPYERWTLRGMLDLNNELMVAEEFWDFLGGEGVYSELLDCFEEVGIELRPEIDGYFSRFN